MGTVKTGTRAEVKKLCPCTLGCGALEMGRLCYCGGQAACWRLLSGSGVSERTRTDERVEKGVMQLWALPAHLPEWKRTLHGVHPRSALQDKEVGMVQRGGEDSLFVCNNYKPLSTKDMAALNHYSGSSFLFIFNSLLDPASSCTHNFSLTFLCTSHLLPDYFGRVHKMAVGS